MLNALSMHRRSVIANFCANPTKSDPKHYVYILAHRNTFTMVGRTSKSDIVWSSKCLSHERDPVLQFCRNSIINSTFVALTQVFIYFGSKFESGFFMTVEVDEKTNSVIYGAEFVDSI